MNVDLLESNPSWTTYFYFAIPISLLVMLAVLWLKRKELFGVWHSQSFKMKQKELFFEFRRSLSALFRTRDAKREDYWTDLEMQSDGRLGTVRIVGNRDTFLWGVEHGCITTLASEV